MKAKEYLKSKGFPADTMPDIVRVMETYMEDHGSQSPNNKLTEEELPDWLNKTMEGRHVKNKITFPLADHFKTHPELIPDKLVIELIKALPIEKKVERKPNKLNLPRVTRKSNKSRCPECRKLCTGRSCHDCQQYW